MTVTAQAAAAPATHPQTAPGALHGPHLDYYHILGVKRSAVGSDLHSSYRKLALKLHPHANADSDNDSWRQLNEAYTVLTTPTLRAVYDQYGYRILRFGSAATQSVGGMNRTVLQGLPKASTIAPWEGVTTEQANQQFESFFGTSSPFSVFNNLDLPLSVQPPPVTPTVPAQEINLYVSLEELYSGVDKKVKVWTNVVQHSEKVAEEEKSQSPAAEASPTTVLQEKLLDVTVAPGWKSGTQLRFPSEGDQRVGWITGDIVITIISKEHVRFTRRNNDLVYKQPLTLLEALTGKIIDIQTLDNRQLSISLHDMICTPQNSKRIAGEGMPLAKQPSKRGDLIVEFDITFPQTLNIQQQQSLKQILS